MVPMTFRQLEVFIRVVEAGNFRLCANALSVSEVSVGEHIKALERQLGLTLFHRRRGNAAALTAVGETVFDRAMRVMAAADELVQAGQPAHGSRPRRKVRIGADSYLAYDLARGVAQFANLHPQLDIELQTCSFREIADGLQCGELEVGYFMLRGPVSALDTRLAWQEDIAFYVSEDHPLARKLLVEPRELARLHFAYVPNRNHIRTLIDSLLEELGIVGCPAALTCDDHVAALETVARGESFICMYVRAMARFAPQFRLVRIPLSRPVPPFEVRTAVRAPFGTDKAIAALLDALQAEPLAGPSSRLLADLQREPSTPAERAAAA